MKDDVFVQYVNMDVLVKEQVFANADGSYTILVNARLCREQQLKAYMHAIEHIINGDFDYDVVESVDSIENRAHE